MSGNSGGASGGGGKTSASKRGVPQRTKFTSNPKSPNYTPF